MSKFSFRFCALMLLVVAPLPAMAGTLTTTSIADGIILENGYETQNRGVETSIYVGSPGARSKTLVQFSIAGIPAQQVIDSATLELTINDPASNLFSNGQTIDVRRLLVSWVEGDGTYPAGGTFGATWNSRDKGGSLANWTSPGAAGDGTDRVAAITATVGSANVSGNVLSIDVTGDVAAWYAGAGNFGWLLEDTTPTSAYVAFASNNSVSFPFPTLIVNYHVPAPEPSSIVLLGLGVMGLLSRRRQRR